MSLFKILERLLNNTDEEGECIIWNGYSKNGYGITQINGKQYYVHRLSYMIKIRSENIPKYINGEAAGVVHLCGKSKCVNTDHLELKAQENMNRLDYCIHTF